MGAPLLAGCPDQVTRKEVVFSTAGSAATVLKGVV
jgi:hypothetical protein